MDTRKKKGKTKNKASPPKGNYSILSDIRYLLVKLTVIGLALYAVYFFLFGLIRYNDNGMKPALKDGDLTLFYRLDKQYKIGDLLVFDYEGKMRVARVIATAGSQIDITEDGLLINGSRQQEEDIYSETVLYKDQMTFPLTVPEGHLFVLGDNRKTAVDSRVFGTIPIDKTEGKVVVVIRRRGF